MIAQSALKNKQTNNKTTKEKKKQLKVYTAWAQGVFIIGY